MIAVLEVLIAVALVAVLAVLGAGLVSMFRGDEFNRKYGNYLMRARVATQGAAILLILAYFLITRTT
jgi:type II secretory pathway component PulJ